MNHSLKTPNGEEYSFENLSLELGKQLIEKNSGQLLSKYKELYSKAGGNLIEPYLLNDNRVVILNNYEATIISSLGGYLSSMYTSGMFQKKHIPEAFPILNIKYLSNNKKLFFYEISETIGYAYTKIFPRYGKDNHQSEKVKAYKNDNGEILEHHIVNDLYLNDNYFLFRNKKDYDIYISNGNILKAINVARRTKLDHSLRSQTNIPIACRNPYGESFPDYIDELANQLPDLLNIKKKKLTPDYKGLNYLQQRLFRNIITADFADRVFLSLFAFYGKTFITVVGGEWKMYQEDVADTWIPDIEIEGELIQIYDVILMALDHKSTKCIPLSAPFGKYLGKSSRKKD